MNRPAHISTCVCLLVGFATGNAATLKGMTSIASHGETRISSVLGRATIQVIVFTHEKQIGSPSDRMPSVVDSSCTYSRYPCSIVDRLEITVNGRSLHIPRSVFCDLADMNRAKVDRRKHEYVLIVEGGDASASYTLKIDFDTSRVTRKLLIDGEANMPLEVTTYYQVTM